MALWLPAVVGFVAGTVQGASGFGAGMVAMALLPFVWSLQQSAAVMSGIGLAITSTLAWKLRKEVRRDELVRLILPCLVGVPVGVTFLASLDGELVKAGLGAVLVGYGLYALSGKEPEALSARWGWPIGLVAGMLSGAFQTSGPPVVAYLTARGLEKDAFRGTLQAFFLLQGLLAVSSYAAAGIVTGQTLLWSAAMVPTVLAGTFFGHFLAGKVDQQTFRTCILVGLLGLGAMFLYKGLA